MWYCCLHVCEGHSVSVFNRVIDKPVFSKGSGNERGRRVIVFFTQLPTPPFCFFKFPVSPDWFPSGFIHDLHLEIIHAHENKPSAILGKSCVHGHMWRRTLKASSVGCSQLQCNSGSAARKMCSQEPKPSLPLLKSCCNAFVVWLKSLIRLQSYSSSVRNHSCWEKLCVSQIFGKLFDLGSA